jgi:hypothetical protein
MTKRPERPRAWFIERPTRGVIRFDDREAADAKLAHVQSYAANARLREVG